jgi:transcriptional regulator with XRE-family HTH domain
MCKMPNRIDQAEAVAVGARLRRARVAQGLTLVDVAKGCGCDHTRVSKIERGQFTVLNQQVQKICTFVQVNPSRLGSLSAPALHARLDSLLIARPDAVAAIHAFFDGLEQMAG